MIYIILLIALAGIVFGADTLVNGSVAIARKYKVSDFVIGAAIVGVGTSMPELTVSFLGAIQGNAEVAIGNVVGSNIFNILGILGVTALFCPIVVTKSNLRFEIPVCIGVSVLLTLLVFNFFVNEGQTIGRFDGIVLLMGFALFMWYSFYRDKKGLSAVVSEKQEETAPEEDKPVWLSIIKIIGGLAILILSCDIFVDKAVVIARNFGLDDAFISITLIACGTSLPELAASIAAAARKNTQLALGNILGSNIFNICLILGLSSMVTPLTSTSITTVDYLVMIGAAILPLVFGLRGRLGRVSGGIMFALFIAYTWYLLSIQIN